MSDKPNNQQSISDEATGNTIIDGNNNHHNHTVINLTGAGAIAFLVAALIILVILNGYFAHPTTQNPVTSPTHTPQTISATLPPTLTASVVSQSLPTFTSVPDTNCSLLDERFTTNTHNWEEKTIATSIYSRTTQILDGVYRHINLFSANGTSPIYIPGIHPKDFTLSMDAMFQEFAGKPADNRLFIDLRNSGTGRYRVVFYAPSGYAIDYKDTAGKTTKLIDYTHSNAINFELGAINHIQVDVHGTILTLYVNSQQLNQISDMLINQEGEIAFGAAKADSFGKTIVDFDNLCIQP